MNVGISGEYQKNRNYVEINYANTEVAQKLTMQMTSALSGVKNFRLLDYAYFTRDTGRFLYKPKIKSGEVGPLLIRAAITEYTEVVESDSKKTNIATLYRGSNYKRTGIVGLDFSIINPTNGNIVLSFPIKTTFSSQEKSNSVGLISDMARSKKFAQSALDQALRQALYEASKKIYYSLLED